MKFYFLLLSIALMVSSCDFPSILSEDASNEESSTRHDSVADTLLAVQITGSIAGVLQNLLVDESGLAVFTDNQQGNQQWTVQLSDAELRELIDLFAQNDFLSLRGPFVDPRVADAFFYRILFIQGNQRNTVFTDRFGAPEPLQRIVDGMVALKNRVTENGLSLKLDVKPLAEDHKFDLTLIVTNVSNGPIDLRFNSSQIFDFYVRRPSTESSFNQSGGFLWHWSSDKVFAAVLSSISLLAGESLAYQVTWDGRDNAGNVLTGEVLIGATLKSVPGGSAVEQIVKL